MTNENTEKQNDTPLDEQIRLQEENIEKYKDMLRRYQSGRWYDLYRRNLCEKEDHLRALREKWEVEMKIAAEISPDPAPNQTASQNGSPLITQNNQQENTILENINSLARVVRAVKIP